MAARLTTRDGAARLDVCQARGEPTPPTRWKEPRRMSKTKKRLTGGLVALLLFAAAGVAWAGYLLVTEVTGSVTSGAFAIYGTTLGTDAVATTGTCTVTMTDNGVSDTTPTFDVQWSGGPIAGDTCTVTLAHEAPAGNADDAVLEGATIGGSITGGEITATLGTACGTTVTPGGSASIDLVLTITGTADPGTAYDLAGTSLTWAPSAIADASGCQ